jgi:hypothetical protein
MYNVRGANMWVAVQAAMDGNTVALPDHSEADPEYVGAQKKERGNILGALRYCRIKGTSGLLQEQIQR